MKKKIVKIFACFSLLFVLGISLVIPCFASATNNVVGKPVTLANPFTIHFASYDYFCENQLINQSFTESCVYQQMNSEYPFVDDAALYFDSNGKPLYIDRNFAISNNQVYGSLRVYSEEDIDSPYSHYFTGVSFIEPFFFQTDTDKASSLGYFSFEHVDLSTVNFLLYRYEIFNFDTYSFDARSIVLPLDIEENLFFPIEVLSTISSYPQYSKSGISVIGSMDISPTSDVTGSIVSGVRFDEMYFSPSKTYTGLGNRNDEYFIRVVKSLVNDIPTEKEYVYVASADWTSWLTTSVSSFLNAPIFGSSVFTMGGLLSIVIGLSVFLIFLKIFAGG